MSWYFQEKTLLPRYRILYSSAVWHWLINPEFIDKEVGVMAFPTIFRSALRKMGIQFYLKLEVQQ